MMHPRIILKATTVIDFPLLLQRIRRSFRRHARDIVIGIVLMLFKLSEI